MDPRPRHAHHSDLDNANHRMRDVYAASGTLAEQYLSRLKTITTKMGTGVAVEEIETPCAEPHAECRDEF